MADLRSRGERHQGGRGDAVGGAAQGHQAPEGQGHRSPRLDAVPGFSEGPGLHRSDAVLCKAVHGDPLRRRDGPDAWALRSNLVVGFVCHE